MFLGQDCAQNQRSQIQKNSILTFHLIFITGHDTISLDQDEDEDDDDDDDDDEDEDECDEDECDEDEHEVDDEVDIEDDVGNEATVSLLVPFISLQKRLWNMSTAGSPSDARSHVWSTVFWDFLTGYVNCS